jgi:FMN phosphatase YigB (HAD superfamily)
VACLQRLGFSGLSTLYIDDRIENVEGARAAGLDAIPFETPAAFAAALKEYEFDLVDFDVA